MSVHPIRRFGAWAFIAALALVLSSAAIAAPPDTFITPPDITPSSFWRIDYFDTDGVGGVAIPSSGITAAPALLPGYGTSALQVVPGDGIGGSGCTRLGGKTFFGTQALDGIALSELSTVSYSYLVHVMGNTNGTYPPGDNNAIIAPYINIFIDRNNDGIFRYHPDPLETTQKDTILIYEPLYTYGWAAADGVDRDTWYTDAVIGAGATGRWHTAGEPLPGVGAGSPNTVDLWDEVMAVDLGGTTVADLKIVNPDAGCDAGTATSDEGTGSGFVFVTGQKSGDNWQSFEGYIDGIVFEANGVDEDINLTVVQSVTATSGTAQTADAGFAFDAPLVVTVLDTNGDPVAGETVTFTAPLSGASAVFPQGNVVLTDVNGVARALPAANNDAGAYTVTAEADGREVTFSLENIAQAAFTKEYVLPQDVNSGDFWITDTYNNVDANDALVFGEIAANPAGITNPIAGYGNSSFQFNTGPGEGDPGAPGGCDRMGGKVFLGTTMLEGVALKDLKGFGYSLMFADASVDFNYPAYVNVFIDLNGDGEWTPSDSILAYEPSRVPNQPGPGTRPANTWFDTLAIGPSSTSGWLTSGSPISGIPTLASNQPGIPWNTIVSTPFGAGTVGDLKIVNPDPGCDDAGPADDEGTEAGFNIQFGQKTGGSYNNGVHHVDKLLLAVDGVVTPTSFDFALFGDPATLTITGGDEQSAHVNVAFTEALSVLVADSEGNLVADAEVTFTAPSTGAGATFSSGGIVLTDANGVASVMATANGTAGTYDVTVTVGSLSDTLSLTNIALPACTTDCYVDVVNGSEYNSGLDAANALPSIESAMTYVSAGGTVHIAAGAYTEQLIVTKSVTITGAGVDSTSIVLPATPVTVDGVVSQIRISSAETLTIENLTVDGGADNGLICGAIFYGVYAYGGATLHLDTVTVTDTHISPLSNLGCQTGRAVVYGDVSRSTPNASGTVNNVTVTRYQKSGIVVAGVGSSVAITNSAVSEGSFDMSPYLAQNGIQFQYGATGSVSSTTIDGMQCTLAVICGADAAAGSGILIYEAGDGITLTDVTVTNTDAGLNLRTDSTVTLTDSSISDSSFYNIHNQSGVLTVSDSTLTGSRYGIITTSGPFDVSTVVTGTSISGASEIGFYVEDGTPLAVSITASNISGNGAGAVNNTGTTVAATCNFWGAPNGPSGAGNGDGDSVSAGVTFSPWRLSSASDSPCEAAVSGPFKLVKVSGDNQHAKVNTAFAAPLVVQVTDVNGAPLQGAKVQFAILTRVPEATFTPADGLVTTDANGMASLQVTANAEIGSYDVVASTGAVFTAFALTNDPDTVVAPTNLAAAATGATKVQVTWTSTATHIDTLSLERSADGGTTFTAIAAPANTATQYDDSGLTCGTTYSYRLVVTNVNGSATSNVATVTTNPCGELLANGSFETALAGNWKATTTSGDKRKCSTPNENSSAGDCSLLFKGSANENTVFKQKVADLSALSAGDTLYISASFKSTAANPKVKVRVVFTFAGGTKEKYDLDFETTSPTFTSGTDSITLTTVPNKIIVQLRNKSKAGKAFLDEVSLQLNDVGTRSDIELLPPPAAPEGFRGSN